MINPVYIKSVAVVTLSLLTLLANPVLAGMKTDKLKAIDEAIDQSVEAGEIPGAVLWIESKGERYHSAFGNRSTFPEAEPMTTDTVFDLASLTKVMATAPSILLLHEQGRLSLDDPVWKYIPEVREGGVQEKAMETVVPTDRETITIRDLLTHQSGLPPSIYLSIREFWGHEEGVRRAAVIDLLEKPRSRFRYSDVNYILLGEILRRVSGLRIDRFSETHLFRPLSMSRTGYRPPDQWIPNTAPTTFVEDYGLIRGQVHDPVCRRMEGVAGHAGLFSTAEDVAAFCRLYLNRGQTNGVRIFREESIALATRSQSLEGLGAERGLGWDMNSRYAYQRGEKFPHGGYGHTGWTGTSIWIDPESDSFVILLANRNHPNENGKIRNLRIRVGTLAAEAIGYTEPIEGNTALRPSGDDGENSLQTAGDGPAPVKNGIDVLEATDFSVLRGLRIGLITNHTGINMNRRSTIDLLAEGSGFELVKLFSPEHGIRGVLETDSVDDGKDRATGLPVYSLYKAESRQPTAEQLADIDALVFDIQDIGCRFYTYISTMGLSMEAAHKHGKRFIVLDRVNPIGGERFDGPIRTGEGNDFVAYHDIPVQHGMTVGELAKMFHQERELDGLDLVIVPVQGWKRSMYFDATGLPWLNPSPNIRSLTEALLYPGVGLLEFSNLSVGRGTRTPFEVVGAPWITEGRLASRLNEENLPGISFIPIRFTPDASKYQNEDCGGIRMFITDRELMNPIDVGLAIGRAVQADYPETFTLDEKGNVLLRHPETHEKWVNGESIRSMRKGWESSLKKFKKRRRSFLLYQ